jgi:hypothetical protein
MLGSCRGSLLRDRLELGREVGGDIRDHPHLLEQGTSWAQFNQTVCALRFCYRVTLKRPWAIEHLPYGKKPKRLPVVLSQEEVVRFLGAVRSAGCRTALTTAHAPGLRVSEVAALRVEDIDSARMLIHVEQGKGDKARLVPLSAVLLGLLRVYWRRYRPRPWLFPGRGRVIFHEHDPPTDYDDYPRELAPYAMRDPERMIVEARGQGKHVGRFMERLLSGTFPWAHLRQAQHLLRLTNKYGRERLDRACRRALHFDLIHVGRVQKIVVAGVDTDSPGKPAGQLVLLPAARFLRPAGSFDDQPPTQRQED